MERIAEPLRQMGAQIETTDGHLPLTVTGTKLTAIDYALPVASAQVKSAILLAGLGAEGKTTVIEPAPTRDHTELMLRAAGARVTTRPNSASVDGATSIQLGSVDVPGDFSSAAPFIVAASLVPESRITIHGVNLNPRRTGLLEVLDRMGARVGILERTRIGSEQAGTLEVRSGELRLKETDRIDALVDALKAVGGRARGHEDGFSVTGVPTRPRGGKVESRDDHRIAMLGAVAGVWSREGVRVEGAESVAISFPGFYELLDRLAQR